MLSWWCFFLLSCPDCLRCSFFFWPATRASTWFWQTFYTHTEMWIYIYRYGRPYTFLDACFRIFRLPPMFIVLLTGRTREHFGQYSVNIQRCKCIYIYIYIYMGIRMLFWWPFLSMFLSRLPPIFIFLLAGHTREHVISGDRLYTYRDVKRSTDHTHTDREHTPRHRHTHAHGRDVNMYMYMYIYIRLRPLMLDSFLCSFSDSLQCLSSCWPATRASTWSPETRWPASYSTLF